MKINLGSGTQPKQGYINLDGRNLPEVDVVRDILRGLPFADNSIEEVFSENFMEHLPQTECIWVMNEIWRVLIPGGIAEHWIPPAGSMNFFQDPTHTAHWSERTFNYFKAGDPKNAYYGGDIKPWDIEKIELLNGEQILHVIIKKHNPGN